MFVSTLISNVSEVSPRFFKKLEIVYSVARTFPNKIVFFESVQNDMPSLERKDYIRQSGEYKFIEAETPIHSQ